MVKVNYCKGSDCVFGGFANSDKKSPALYYIKIPERSIELIPYCVNCVDVMKGKWLEIYTYLYVYKRKLIFPFTESFHTYVAQHKAGVENKTYITIERTNN